MRQSSLVESAKQDPEAFGYLFEQYFELIYKYFWYRCSNKGLTEDLTSDTFYKALRQLGKFQGTDEDFLPWLYTIARNTWIDRLRKRVEEPMEIDANLAIGENPYLQMEEHLDILQLLSQLPETQRQVIQLRFIDDLTVKEVAQKVGKTETATKSIIFRALKQLKEFAMKGGYPV